MTRRARPRRRPARRPSARRPAPRLQSPLALLRSTSWRRRALAAAVAAGALALTYFAWFRDSSLVAVHDVKVEGVSSTDQHQIVAALTDSAQGMTTLHVQADRLESAVRQFPTVASVSADPSFPHGMTIRVAERQPALVVTDGDHQVAVAADGSALPGLHVQGQLPELRVDTLPATGRLSGDPLTEALAIGAAPAPIRPLVAGASVSRDYGIIVTMRGGIELRLGSGDQLDQKWAAIAAILADRQVTSLSYVDVRVPNRPAAGGA
jgi:cell division protein FtsQ